MCFVSLSRKKEDAPSFTICLILRMLTFNQKRTYIVYTTWFYDTVMKMFDDMQMLCSFCYLTEYKI